MSKAEYPYPPDEFDAVDPSAGPRGVHRRPRSRWGTLWPFLVAVLASAALAFAVVALVWDERAPTAATTADPGVAATEPGPTEPGPTGTTPAPAETATEAPPAPPAPVETPAPPPPEPDLATPVTVYNSTSVQGLAADAAERLEDAGWDEVTAGNYPGGTLPGSTVFYASTDLEVSARAVAEVLGIGVVELAESDATEGIEVVLERDFAG